VKYADAKRSMQVFAFGRRVSVKMLMLIGVVLVMVLMDLKVSRSL
jgi:hypothetical protein